MAQPDEVWNFGRGDGAEKAFLMADAIIHNDPAAGISMLHLTTEAHCLIVTVKPTVS